MALFQLGDLHAAELDTVEQDTTLLVEAALALGWLFFQHKDLSLQLRDLFALETVVVRHLFALKTLVVKHSCSVIAWAVEVGNEVRLLLGARECGIGLGERIVGFGENTDSGSFKQGLLVRRKEIGVEVEIGFH